MSWMPEDPPRPPGSKRIEVNFDKFKMPKFSGSLESLRMGLTDGDIRDIRVNGFRRPRHNLRDEFGRFITFEEHQGYIRPGIKIRRQTWL